MKTITIAVMLLISTIALSQVTVKHYNHWDELTSTKQYTSVQFKPNEGDRRMYIRYDGNESSNVIKSFPTNPLYGDFPEPTWIYYLCYQSTVHEPPFSILFNLKENKVKFIYQDGSYTIYSGVGLKYTNVYSLY